MSKQTAKLIARIAENLPEMPSEIMQEWIENPKELQEFLGGLVPAQADYVDTFFQTRGGLWVSENFRSLVVAKAQPAEAVAMREFNLPRHMLDSEIEAELGEGHIWDESHLCAALKVLIEEQWGGKSGKLLNNGHANLFYTSSCVVYVHWLSGHREWRVNTWPRDDGRWDGGDRVFSPVRDNK